MRDFPPEERAAGLRSHRHGRRRRLRLDARLPRLRAVRRRHARERSGRLGVARGLDGACVILYWAVEALPRAGVSRIYGDAGDLTWRTTGVGRGCAPSSSRRAGDSRSRTASPRRETHGGAESSPSEGRRSRRLVGLAGARRFEAAGGPKRARREDRRLTLHLRCWKIHAVSASAPRAKTKSSDVVELRERRSRPQRGGLFSIYGDLYATHAGWRARRTTAAQMKLRLTRLPLCRVQTASPHSFDPQTSGLPGARRGNGRLSRPP